MPRQAVTVRGESSSRREPRRLLLRALAENQLFVRIHNIENTSGMECVLARGAIESVAAGGPNSGANVAAVGGTATAQLAVRTSGETYVWIFTPGHDGWDILVSQAQLARALGELVRL